MVSPSHLHRTLFTKVATVLVHSQHHGNPAVLEKNLVEHLAAKKPDMSLQLSRRLPLAARSPPESKE